MTNSSLAEQTELSIYSTRYFPAFLHIKLEQLVIKLNINVKIYQKLVHYFYIPKLKKLDEEIGCRLLFNYIPQFYINSIMSCEMTKTWKKYGLDIEKGKNYFTVGKIVKGISSRFDRNSNQYQSWLGGYTVKLSPGTSWSFEKYFKLAIADQNSWLEWYNAPQPKTSIEGWTPKKIGDIRSGKFIGTLYEFGCTTYSDVGNEYISLKLYFATKSMAALFNIYNPKLELDFRAFIPNNFHFPFERVELKGYFVIFDVKPNLKTILYGCGAVTIDFDSRIDKFLKIQNDLLQAIKSCEIRVL